MDFTVKAMVPAGIRKWRSSNGLLPRRRNLQKYCPTPSAQASADPTRTIKLKAESGIRAVHLPFGHECCAVAADAGQHCCLQGVLFTILRSGL